MTAVKRAATGRATTALCLALGLAGCGTGPKPFDHLDPATGYRMRGSGILLELSGPPTYEAAMAVARTHCRNHFSTYVETWDDRIDVPGKEYRFLCGDSNW